MKKTLSILALLVFATSVVYAEEPVSLSSFLNKQVSKVAEKENEINAKLEAKRKADEEKRAEIEKKQAEQREAINARLNAIKEQQEAQKRDAEARKAEAKKQQEETKEAIEKEVNYWKGLFKPVN